MRPLHRRKPGSPVGVLPGARGGAAHAAGYFQRALACDPGHVLAGLSRAEALLAAGQKQPAIDQARRTLTTLDQPLRANASWLDAGHFPPEIDLFHGAWEHAAWSNV